MNRILSLKLLPFIFSLVVLFPILLQAQTTTADITGTITDTTGRVIPNAAVTVTNVGTNLSRTANTNESGEYTVTELPPGIYTVAVEAASFSKTVLTNLELQVGSRRTENIELKAGGVTETVEVTADNAIVETTRSEIDTVISQKEVENLPLLNRTFANLSVVAPEARPVGNFDPTKTRVGNFAISGGDGRQIAVNVDGGDNKDHVVGGILQNFAFESIQEFQVLQHRWTAEAGRAVGGVVNVVTKSGANSLRGSGFANFRDEKLTALNFFDKQSQSTNPSFTEAEFNRQELGGSIGGPIIKDRLFFFGALERFRERGVARITNTAVANQLQAIPGIQFVNEIPTPYNDTLLSAKIDHKLTEEQNMFYRYAFQKNDSPNDQVANPATTDLTGGNLTDNRLHSFVVGHNFNVTSNSLNQFAFHFQDFFNEILPVTTNPLVSFPGGVAIGANVNTPQSTTERKWQFRNDFTFTTGNHNVKVGGNYIYTQLGGYFYFGSKGYTVNFFDSPLTIRNNTNGLYPQGFATPGAVQSVSFAEGEASHDQNFHQVAFYGQDDWKVTRKLTLNLGLRWDANIGNLPDQTNNRTILILQQLNDPFARTITGDADKLRRTTPKFTEFQPRFGFAFDPRGDGKSVIRGGYGIFYDQLFQNLTIFSLTQGQSTIYQQALTLINSAVGVGQLPNFRYGVDPLPAPPAGFSFSNLATGGFGRINDPDATEPYVQKFSIGFQTELGRGITLQSDYVHTLGLFEPRVQNINPQIRTICDAAFPGSTPTSPLCVRGANSRRLDRAFVNAGLPANRLEQINMIGTTNRSFYDSWTTQLKYRRRNASFNLGYVLASSRSWGGQPLASYTGNGIAVTPEQQFREEEFGPTRIDERHRIVISGVFSVPFGIQLSPLAQFATARPYSPTVGVDIDGDGLATNDRLCQGVDPLAVFAVRGNQTAIRALNPRGCTQADVNNQRDGFVVDSAGNITRRSGRFFNVDLRAQKDFRFGERFKLSGYADFYNIFNTENLSFAPRTALSPATSAAAYLQPVSLFGPGFGPPVGRPFTLQLGARFTF